MNLDDPIEDVRALGSFRLQADSVHIPSELPPEVRIGIKGFGDLLVRDADWGRAFIHEFVHHLQTITTFSGIRLFHYYWTNRLHLLSTLDPQIRKDVAGGRPLPEAVAGFRRAGAYASSGLVQTDYELGRFAHFYARRPVHEVSDAGDEDSGVRVSLRVDRRTENTKAGKLDVPEPLVTIDYPDGARQIATLGAMYIREGCAKAVEDLYVMTFHEQRRAATDATVRRLLQASDPDVSRYYTALNVFLALVQERKFRELGAFVAVCELALMWDPVVAEFAAHRGGEGRRFATGTEELEFWSRDVGPGYAFVHLLKTLNQNAGSIPAYDAKTNGGEFYQALSKHAHFPLTEAAVGSAVEFVESDQFLFNSREWASLFGPTRARMRRGLQLRREYLRRPLFSYILNRDLDFLQEIAGTPVLVCYTNTITGPTADNAELSLLLFSELVASVLRTGRARCFLKYEHPYLCQRSGSCSQGEEHQLGLDEPPRQWWCPYMKGLLVLQEWLVPGVD